MSPRDDPERDQNVHVGRCYAAWATRFGCCTTEHRRSPMSLRYVYGTLTAVVFSCGVMTVGTANAQLRDGGLLPPEEHANMTIVGCLLRGDSVLGGKEKFYVLANPIRGPVNSV